MLKVPALIRLFERAKTMVDSPYSKLLTTFLHVVRAAAISQTLSKLTGMSPRELSRVAVTSSREHPSTSPGDHALIIAFTSLR